jgi:hypothetical protein
MFTIATDARLKLIRTAFQGFLTMEEVVEWGRQEQEAVVALGCRSREFLLYVDTSLCAIQSQEVVALFQKLIATSKRKARRIAIMQGSSLTKMQTRRIVAGVDYIRHFSDRTEAETWLFEDEKRNDGANRDASG